MEEGKKVTGGKIEKMKSKSESSAFKDIVKLNNHI